MNRAKLAGALAAAAVLTVSLPLLAEPLTWPWKSKTPSDPALVGLYSIEDVTVTISKSDPPLVTINVSRLGANLELHRASAHPPRRRS